MAKAIIKVRKMKTMLFNTSFFLMLIFPLLIKGQNVTIKGYVTNELNGKYIENVNLFESVSIIGTLTDKNGFYYLTLPQGNINLSAAFDGFLKFTKQFALENDTVLLIKLQPVSGNNNFTEKGKTLQALKNKEVESELK